MAAAASSKPFVLPAAIAASVLLCGFIAFMIESRANILRTGTEIVLETQPFDPRDLLRGHFVRLQYEGQTVTVPNFDGLFPNDSIWDQVGMPIYITMIENEEGHWVADQVSLSRPDEGLFIRGTVRSGVGFTMADGSRSFSVSYGLERFYTNEHRAPELESRMRDGAMTEVVAAVSADGTAQIKALRQDGETILVEPLY